MKPVQIFFICLLLSNAATRAQSVFLKSYGDENGNFISASVTDNNGNTYIAGNFFNPTFQLGDITLEGNGNYVIFLAKIDADGNVVWAISEGGESDQVVFDILLDMNGHIILCGNYYNSGSFSGIELPPGGMNAFLAKYNQQGEIIWAEGLPGFGVSFSDLAIDDENNIIVGGENIGELIFLGNEVEEFGEYDIIYAKYDEGGNPMWLKSFGCSTYDDLTCIATDHEGNIILGGEYMTSFNYEGFIFNNAGIIDGLILKTSPDGVPLWAATNQSVEDDEGPIAITADEQNDLYIGITINPSTSLAGTVMSTYGSSDACLFKLNGDDGDMEWYKTGGSGSNDYMTDLNLTTDGVFITGVFTGAAEFDGLQLYTEFSSAFIAAYDRDGNATQVIGLIGESFVSPIGINTDAHGNAYCTGLFYEDVVVEDLDGLTSMGGQDIFLYKFASSIVPINHISTEEINFTLFPNPTTDYITIQLPDIQTGELFDVTITNTIGQMLYQQNDLALSGSKPISVKEFPAGTMIITIITEASIIHSQSFIKR